MPGQDVTLTGNNVWSRDPLAPFPFLTETGPFKPFGTPAKKGEVIKGEVKCSSGLWRSRPDGSGLELLAWGLRNPYGLAFNEQGELYASDNDLEEKGERAVRDDPDRVWHIRNAATPHGSVTTPDWYGFPEICADGLPAWKDGAATGNSVPGLTDRRTETRMFRRHDGPVEQRRHAVGSRLLASAASHPVLAVTAAVGVGLAAAAVWGTLMDDSRRA